MKKLLVGIITVVLLLVSGCITVGEKAETDVGSAVENLSVDNVENATAINNSTFTARFGVIVNESSGTANVGSNNASDNEVVSNNEVVANNEIGNTDIDVSSGAFSNNEFDVTNEFILTGDAVEEAFKFVAKHPILSVIFLIIILIAAYFIIKMVAPLIITANKKEN